MSWQTVALSLGTALITGGVALGIGILSNRTQRRLHLRARQIDTASELSRHVNGAAHAVRYTRSHPDEEGPRDRAQWVVGELTPLVGTISFLFAKHPGVPGEATEAANELARALALPRDDEVQAEGALEASHAHMEEFQRAVGRVVGA